MKENFDSAKFFSDTDLKVHDLSDQIPKINDVTLVVIKGHLVIERCLHEILQLNMSHQKHLEEARLTFAQLLNLVMAISKLPLHEETFKSIRKLNLLRNHLAHNLPNEKTESMINEFINMVGVEIDGHSTQAQKVWDQIYGLLGAISILISVEKLLCSGMQKSEILEILKSITSPSSRPRTGAA